MDFSWLVLYALGGVVAFYALAVVVILIIARIKPGDDSEGTMRWVSGETIFVPREPGPPRKRWRSPSSAVNRKMAGQVISELDIYRAANLLVRRHGDDAAIEAARKSDLMLGRGDTEGQRVWLRIKRAIAELAGAADRASALAGCRYMPVLSGWRSLSLLQAPTILAGGRASGTKPPGRRLSRRFAPMSVASRPAERARHAERSSTISTSPKPSTSERLRNTAKPAASSPPPQFPLFARKPALSANARQVYPPAFVLP